MSDVVIYRYLSCRLYLEMPQHCATILPPGVTHTAPVETRLYAARSVTTTAPDGVSVLEYAPSITAAAL